MRLTSQVTFLRFQVFHAPWQPLQDKLLQNQSISRFMAAIEEHRDHLANGKPSPFGSFLKALAATIAAGGAIAAAVMVMIATRSAQPIGLVILALLAVTGIFFLFGLLSGFVRFQENGQVHEIARGVAETDDHALQVLTDDGSIVFANTAFMALFGTAQKSIEELLATDPRAGEAVYRLARAAERLEPHTEDVAVRANRQRGAGQQALPLRWLRVSVKPFQPAASISDRRRMTLWDATDITADRARELNTVGSLEQQLAYYDTMPVGLFAVTADGRIPHLNYTLSNWLGLRSDQARSTMWSLTDICPPEAAALVQGVSRRPPGTVERFDIDLVRDDGRAIPVRLVCRTSDRPASDRSDRDAPLTVLVFDRASDLAGDGAARSLEERFARLFHGAPFAIATLDRQGAVVSANATFQRMCNRDATPPAGPVKLADLVLADASPDDRQAVEAGLARVTTGRATAAPFEVSFGPDQQTTRRIYMSPLTVGADPREAAILYMLDTSELKALELKFIQSQKLEAVGKLAGGIAHDFNNVLTVIIGMSDLLLQSRRPNDPGYTDVMQIRSNANRAASMVQQLLAFSRKQTLKPEVLTLNDVIQDFGYSLNRLLGEKIDLKHAPGRDLWFVKADKTQFDQILINLTVNARDAMPAGGRLTIRTRNISVRDSLKLASQNVSSGEYVLTEVEDTGTGMPADVVAKIFEPYFTTKEVGKGTGLGLSTVYGIVKQTGGYIFCDSVQGRGTTFRIYLPRHIPAPSAPVIEVPAKAGPSTDLSGTGRVLLVEDEDGVRSFAMRALQRQGYEVFEAVSGVDALEVMEREGGKVDIVVSDVIMPEMDGPTMFKELRKKHPNLKIIFVSGYPDDAFKNALGEHDTFAFLPKPFTLSQLAEKVKEQLGR
jgi:two-component system, cell cycle sensor histidine kinase and response regulator CckA